MKTKLIQQFDFNLSKILGRKYLMCCRNISLNVLKEENAND